MKKIVYIAAVGICAMMAACSQKNETAAPAEEAAADTVSATQEQPQPAAQPGEVIEFSANDELVAGDKPVVVDFWATWCGPCRMIAPIIDQLSTELAGKIKVGKVDVDANNGLAATYGVRTIPTLLIIKDGEIMDTMVGASSKDAIMQRLRPFM